MKVIIRASRTWIVLALVGAGIAGSAAGREPDRQREDAKPSFDCARATSPAERLICGDAALAQQDRDQAESYVTLLRRAPAAAHPAIVQGQRDWLKQRDACRDRDCIESLYQSRQERLWSEIARYGAILRRGVSRIGQCQVTTIEEIGPRLEGGDRPDETGTSVSFANGVSQVSYDLEQPVARSRVGDPVRVCLVSIPRGCPPGDDRGREYAVTNLRTKGHWRMPDSQHMCGGA